ncbi:unnamed protein product [Rhizoctonia solani]|uniref:Phosphatidylglycerol/phosphatidylinositol transfer protein n=1 Tax=Rhizoctonia solani TaxID=456999 RepID=A0A8H3DX64_9AGAM|nr:unnamed protein product [Rhizoctonia solani]
MTQSELYRITLRDTTFTLDRSQIEFDSPNYFTSCFLGSFSESHAREITISRNPALFSIIVNYLSGYAILPIQPPAGMSEQAAVENLLRDALFYGLDELAGVLEEHKLRSEALRGPEEKVVKSYAMIVWPQGMGGRKGYSMVRLSESQAHAQCSAHSLSPGTVPLLQSTGTSSVNQLLKEQKIKARSWTWAAFWTTMKSTNNQMGPRIENDCAVLEITELPAKHGVQIGALLLRPSELATTMFFRLPIALLTAALTTQAAFLPSIGGLIDQARLGREPHITNSWSYTDCGLPSDAVQIKSIKLSPDPPQIGKDLTITARGVVTQKIEDGAYADVTVKLGLVKLLHKQFDICEEARNNNVTVQCPVEPGEYEVVQTVQLPRETPRARFIIDVKGYTSDEALDSDLVCLQLKVDFIGRPWLSL